MQIDPVAAGSTAPAKKADDAASADRFLAMLVAQLKNQDPLNPLDNAQVTTQMAQISTVEGINKLNATLAAMSASFASSQSLQAASMVGRQVMAEGSALALAGNAGRGGYQLDAPADDLTLTVKSASGAVVHVAHLGAQAAGLHVFEWDGIADSGQKAAEGIYSFEIAAKSGKDALAVKTLTLGRVDGVSPSASGTTLDLGALGQVPLAGVKHIF